MIRLTDGPDMTLAVYHGGKTTTNYIKFSLLGQERDWKHG